MPPYFQNNLRWDHIFFVSFLQDFAENKISSFVFD